MVNERKWRLTENKLKPLSEWVGFNVPINTIGLISHFGDEVKTVEAEKIKDNILLQFAYLRFIMSSRLPLQASKGFDPWSAQMAKSNRR